MNDEDKKLIDHATAITSPATPGPWQWWTSCSYRRLSSVPSATRPSSTKAVAGARKSYSA